MSGPVNYDDIPIGLAEIGVAELGRDTHLAKCGLALESGPDGTLACAECGRAMWMHSTRHDTCGSFCWVTGDTLIAEQVVQIAVRSDIPEWLREACARSFGMSIGAGYVRDARRTCATAINFAKRRATRAREPLR